MKKEYQKFKEKLREKKEKEKFAQEFQKKRGKLTAHERINLLVDENSFLEFEPFSKSFVPFVGKEKERPEGDGVICGIGKIDGREVFLYAQDFSQIGGSLGETHGRKIAQIIREARRCGCPLIGLIDSGGARIQEGIFGLDRYGEIFRELVLSSGVIPTIAAILGPSAGGASYSPGLSDFVLMTKNISTMYITGPRVIKEATGEEISLEDLGGGEAHARKSGCAHFLFETERDLILGIRKLLSYLPSNNLEEPPVKKSFFDLFEKESSEILKILPEKEEKSYDIKKVIDLIFDRNSFLEVHQNFAQNVVVGFARLRGEVVGIVATQPKIMAGCLDINSSCKIARFVRFCDAFNIPLINLVDTPGYLPGVKQEHEGIIRHGAKVLFAYAEATVPKISLIIRKAFGGAYIALCSKLLGYDKVLAWPSAQIAVMGKKEAVAVLFKKEISSLEGKEKKEFIEKKEKEYQEYFLNPWRAAEAGKIDQVIDPLKTREILSKLIFLLKRKREGKVPKKHGNIPL